MRPLFYILAISLLCFSCKKDTGKTASTVEIYLLKNYQMMAGKCQIDPVASTLQDAPIIKNQEILKYSPSTYQFKLSENAIQKVKNFGDNMPFAVTVNKQVIYYGLFKPGFSSSSCDNSITMDFNLSSGNISLALGYPGPLPGVVIDDQRNNPDLIAALKTQGKLN